MSQNRHRLIDLTVFLLRETEKAWHVSQTGDEEDSATWIPKSQGEMELNFDKKSYTLVVPEWLATEKGLI